MGRVLSLRKGFIVVFVLFLSWEAWGGGTVSGTVTYKGIPPLPKRVPVGVDSTVCGIESVSEDLIVGKVGGKKTGIKNVVVGLRGPIEGAKSFPIPPGGFVVDQKGCRFEPHLLLVAAGAPVTILNPDRLLHGLRVLSQLNPPIVQIQPPASMKSQLTLERPEAVELRCDMHPWKQAWLVVGDHPYYAVTDEEGRYRLTDVPAGDYTLTLWHERLGTQDRRIQVREGEETRVDFRLTLSK